MRLARRESAPCSDTKRCVLSAAIARIWRSTSGCAATSAAISGASGRFSLTPTLPVAGSTSNTTPLFASTAFARNRLFSSRARVSDSLRTSPGEGGARSDILDNILPWLDRRTESAALPEGKGRPLPTLVRAAVGGGCRPWGGCTDFRLTTSNSSSRVRCVRTSFELNKTTLNKTILDEPKRTMDFAQNVLDAIGQTRRYLQRYSDSRAAAPGFAGAGVRKIGRFRG